jgi:hypothetical protein
MIRLSREAHCALGGIKVEAFKTLQRYGWLPVLPAYLRSEKPFTPIETLVLAIYNAMYEQHRIARVYAANICSRADILVTRWSELRQTAAERREAKKPEILFGRVMRAQKQDQGEKFPVVEPILGTLEEIANQHPTALTIIAVSVTRVAGTIRSRALNHKIDLTDFWVEPVPASPVPSRKKGPLR